MRKLKIVSMGEVLWDVFGKNEFLGGAPLNFAANVRRLGHSVVFLTAVGRDTRGTDALRQMHMLGLPTDWVQTVTDRATGTAIVTTDSAGNATFVINRPSAFDCLCIDDALLVRLRDMCADWIYFGTLTQTDTHSEQALLQVIQALPQAKRFYDMNLRTDHWNFPLVQRLSALATVLKLNDTEAERLFELTFGPRQFCLEEFCKYWCMTYGIEIICVTLGKNGCAVFTAGTLSIFNGFIVNVADTVGSGDAFASAFLHGLNCGWPIARIASFANALGALVASRAGATPPWTEKECFELIESKG